MKIKIWAIKHKGGKCELCEYSGCADVFDFHHIDPDKKSFGICSGNTRSWKSVKVELDKCMLLCANCHRTAHYNLKKTKYIEREILDDIKNPKPFKSPKAIIAKRCRFKIDWPSDEKLAVLVWEYPRTTLAKELGVSSGAIGKRCRLRNITQPSRGYWSKVKSTN